MSFALKYQDSLALSQREREGVRVLRLRGAAKKRRLL
jgi:hypothetical protein